MKRRTTFCEDLGLGVLAGVVVVLGIAGFMVLSALWFEPLRPLR